MTVTPGGPAPAAGAAAPRRTPQRYRPPPPPARRPDRARGCSGTTSRSPDAAAGRASVLALFLLVAFQTVQAVRDHDSLIAFRASQPQGEHPGRGRFRQPLETLAGQTAVLADEGDAARPRMSSSGCRQQGFTLSPPKLVIAGRSPGCAGRGRWSLSGPRRPRHAAADRRPAQAPALRRCRRSRTSADHRRDDRQLGRSVQRWPRCRRTAAKCDRSRPSDRACVLFRIGEVHQLSARADPAQRRGICFLMNAALAISYRMPILRIAVALHGVQQPVASGRNATAGAAHQDLRCRSHFATAQLVQRLVEEVDQARARAPGTAGLLAPTTTPGRPGRRRVAGSRRRWRSRIGRRCRRGARPG